MHFHIDLRVVQNLTFASVVVWGLAIIQHRVLYGNVLELKFDMRDASTSYRTVHELNL